MPIYRKIKPSSIRNSYKEDYEHLLIWLSPSGGIRQYLFSSTEGIREENLQSSVIDTIADFRSIPNKENITIEMFSTSLNREEFDYVSSVLKSNRILLVDKDSTTTPIAIKSAKKRTARLIKDFEIKFKIMLQEPDLMNV